MAEKRTGSDNPAGVPAPPYFYGIIMLSAFIATLAVIIILSSNNPSGTTDDKTAPAAEMSRLAELRSALENEPENPALNRELGNLFFDSGNYSEAIVYYRRVIISDSTNIAARIDLGVCYFNLGLPDKALLEIKKSLVIDPNHVKGLFNIGVIYYNMGENAQAQRYWKELIRRYEGSQEAQIARQMLDQINT